MNKKTASKKPTICIIGPGVVGQATGKAFIKRGYKTSFYGGNPEKTEKLKKEGYSAFLRTELFDGGYDFDVSMFTVPTPTIDGKIDLGPMKKAAVDLGKRLKAAPKKYHLVVVKSTVPPGTSENLVAKLVAKHSGWKLGKDFGLCMNPEYLREKTAFEDAMKPWVIVVGAYDKRSGDLLVSIYKKFLCPLYTCSLKEAEFQKYAHNLFNAAKITFFNEMRQIGQAINIETEKVFNYTVLSCEGIWNPQYGVKDKGAFSGSCLPKDTKAFLRWARRNRLEAPLLATTIRVNDTVARKNGIDTKKITVGSNL